jgi:pimeloyl-ACP methyl ester carboxylesterase
MLTSFADGKLFGDRTGSNPPKVLLLHGWRGDSGQMSATASGLDAITLDLPGFGKSPIPTQTWGAREYAQQVATTLEVFEEPAVVVGYSFGGRVALNLAVLRPDKVKALVLTGVPLIRRNPASSNVSKTFRLLKWANRVGVVSDDRMEAERRKRGSADYRAASGVMRDIFVKVVNESYEHELARVGCPVELVWGDADTEAPLHNALEAEQILSNSKLTVVENGTHWSLVQDGTQIREAVMRCL